MGVTRTLVKGFASLNDLTGGPESRPCTGLVAFAGTGVEKPQSLPEQSQGAGEQPGYGVRRKP
jgi:hypothetical protein